MTATYDSRSERAHYLKTIYPFAVEILTFYEGICAAQARIHARVIKELRNTRPPAEATLRERLDVDLVVPCASDALTEIIPVSPEPLRAFITEYLGSSKELLAVSLQTYVDHGGTDEAPAGLREELLARILIEPYSESVAQQITVESSGVSGNLCPRCDGRPLLGVLRPEGDGGKRFLKCSFCSSEWEYRRIFCAYCGEDREQSLPVFVAEKFPHIRVEACDTCRHCLRTVDLTKDGNAIPTVDDLAAIPLALWTEEYGYQRIHGNLLGT
jgi:formate dehydrogenase maturation protein FdhE